ncbi:MAG: transcription termination factor NusA, partial [Candidatus Omnitrophica bacterium]|nr:transcription termination factor NusA [Candidatus Omnitrophota bacterium]
QCPGERYKQGDRLRAYILEVSKTAHGPQIVLSRSDAAFVKKLFEIEVPEITEGIVEVKAIAREPGERTKIAVWSKDDKVDAVGACVGVRGSRVKDIVKELQGERVDIVRWSDDIREYVKTAMSPAEPMEIKIDKEKKAVEVIVPDDQLSIGIGKHGQNVRLASKLTGWEIDIRGKEEKAKKAAEAVMGPAPEGAEAAEGTEAPAEEAAQAGNLSDLEGVGPKTEKALIAAGFGTVEKIRNASVEDLTKCEGIGEKTAQKILKSAKETE